MPSSENFFRYLPPSKAFSDCGGQIVCLGFERVDAGERYPLHGHPDDHQFSNRRGRILSAYSIELLTEGEGHFEVGRADAVDIRSGDVLLVFPEVRHRYRPKADTGWAKWWIELSGPSVEHWMQAGEFSPARPVLPQAGNPVLLGAFQELAALTREDRPIRPLLASAVALELIAHIREATEAPDAKIDQAMAMIRAARQLIQDQTANPHLDWEDMARNLGISYSSLRQIFSRLVGVSPGQYHLFLRERSALALLQNSDLSVGEIAQRLGFDSVFYFSRFIKQRTGRSPRALRAGETTAIPEPD